MALQQAAGRGGWVGFPASLWKAPVEAAGFSPVCFSALAPENPNPHPSPRESVDEKVLLVALAARSPFEPPQRLESRKAVSQMLCFTQDHAESSQEPRKKPRPREAK